ncbi:MAG: peptidylprolyl isomerase, partial [Blastocatellia bacterium]
SRLILICLCLAAVVCASVNAQSKRADMVSAAAIHARIIQLEDERNLNGNELTGLLKHASAAVRERAALAIGRIGDKRGTEALIGLLRRDKNGSVRAMTAFALGEMEDAQAVSALMELLAAGQAPLSARARAAEALGKIIPPNNELLGQATIEKINARLFEQLPDPQVTLTAEKKMLMMLSIVAIRASRAASANALVQQMKTGYTDIVQLRSEERFSQKLTWQLKSGDADIRALVANVLGRMRQPIFTPTPALLESLNDSDADVRANVTRVLGVMKEAQAVEPLINLLNDKSEQAQVSTIRALAALNDNRAVEPLLGLGKLWLGQEQKAQSARLPQINLLLEVATALGALKDERALPFLRQLRTVGGVGANPEVEIAIARFGEKEFFASFDSGSLPLGDWRKVANLASALGELRTEQSQNLLSLFLAESDHGKLDVRALPAILRALARFKPENMPSVLRRKASLRDVGVRATVANLLGDWQSDENFDALINIFAQSRTDAENDAKLAALVSLSKYKSPRAIETLKAALGDPDHLVRRRTVDLLKQMGAGDFSDRIGIVQTGHDKLFYQRVAARLNKKVTATIHTDKGQIKLELFPRDSPITVDSFVTLARKGFFNDLTFHRVVPNFVIQGGDPRGDGEGGPGYQIRCEINTRPYTRGAVGMALSGKDTGGSQFFITHSPQPHLDGGYTVFGQVVSGMDVVDRISRGDLVRKVEIFESR